MKVFTKESLISELCEIRDKGWIENNRPGNAGGIGNTLEDLLGIEENNLPIPNASEWELKTQRSTTNSLTTLFHMEPSPTALRFVPQILLPIYGWPHEKAGLDYSDDEKSFRQTITGKDYSSRGFKVCIDRKQQKVLISFDSSKVDHENYDWLKKVEELIGLGDLDPQPYWGFNDLNHKAGTKLKNCFYVVADVKKENQREYYSYSKISILSGFSIDCFINGIEEGFVYIDFDARTGHNHGTKFRVRANRIPNLYKDVKQI